MKPRVISIIQGRMSSSRLPGKILADIAGQPMLQRVFIRTSRAATVTETIFATTTDASDDPVATRYFGAATGEEVASRDRCEPARQPSRPGLVMGNHPHHHRIVIERPTEGASRLTDVAPLEGADVDRHS